MGISANLDVSMILESLDMITVDDVDKTAYKGLSGKRSVGEQTHGFARL